MKQIRGQMSESLLLGVLLAVAGGFFDAYTYLCRGRVFANAQTGNIVMLGVRVSEHDFWGALAYLVPIGAFAVGVVAVELVKRQYKSRQNQNINIHWRQVVVLVETVLVAAMAFLPQSMNMAVNIVISLVCAMQVESFRKIRGSAFATTMCTGNLRSGTEQLVIWAQTGDKAALRRSGNYYTIILFFVLGALLGSLAVGCMAEKALLLTVVPLLAVLCIMFIREEEQ